MNNYLKHAFTLVEIIMVIAIIWILMAWMTMYLGNQWQRARIIQAEWCANTFNWQINNQVFNALTSKILNSWNTTYSPDLYLITLTGWNSSWSKNCTSDNDWVFCDTLVFRYANLSWINDIIISGAFDSEITNKECHIWEVALQFYRSGSNDIEYVRMNKWFWPIIWTEAKVFWIHKKWQNINNDLLNWDIIINACFDRKCEWMKQIWKRSIDGRSQTIWFKKCKLYIDTEDICEEREA